MFVTHYVGNDIMRETRILFLFVYFGIYVSMNFFDIAIQNDPHI